MFFGIICLIVIGIGILIYLFGNNGEYVAVALIALATVTLMVFISLAISYQCNKDINFATNMAIRENIVYAIESYEQYGDDLELNRYDVLQKAMDFNEVLISEQARANSIFYIGFRDARYIDAEPVDYSPLLRPNE